MLSRNIKYRNTIYQRKLWDIAYWLRKQLNSFGKNNKTKKGGTKTAADNLLKDWSTILRLVLVYSEPRSAHLSNSDDAMWP